MTGTRISDMPIKAVLAAGDTVPIVSGGLNYRFDLGAANFGMAVSTFTALSGISVPVGTDLIRTASYNGTRAYHNNQPLGGDFYVYDPAVDATYVSAHPRAAVLSANGRGFRLSLDRPVNVTSFGAVGDHYNWLNSIYPGYPAPTDNLAAFTAALAYLRANAKEIEFSGFLAAPVPLIVPQGFYYLSGPLDLDGCAFDFGGGCGVSQQNGANPVILIFAAGVAYGLAIQDATTTGKTGTRAAATGASGSVVRNLKVTTTGTGIGIGVLVRTRARLENVSAFNWPSHGCLVTATSPANGNANLASIAGGNFFRNGDCGLVLSGPDANVVHVERVNASFNARGGIDEDSFLGNTLATCHVEGNGRPGAGVGPTYSPQTKSSVCSYGGNRYQVLPGKATAASTTTPGTDATVWALIGAGAADSTYLAWSSGLTWIDGFAYRASQASARSLWLGCYSESGQASSYLGSGSISVGGLHGVPILGSAGQINAVSGRIYSLQGPAVADLGAAPTNAQIATAFNLLLASLRTSVALAT